MASNVKTVTTPYENTFFTTVGSNVTLNNATQIQNAYKIMKNKKAAITEKNAALALIHNVHYSDTCNYYANMLAGQKAQTVAAFCANTIFERITNHDEIPTLKRFAQLVPDYMQVWFKNRAKVRYSTFYNYTIEEDTLHKWEKNDALFVLEYLTVGVGVCVKLSEKDGVSEKRRTYITRNLNILAQLAKQGCIDGLPADTNTINTWLLEREAELFNSTAEKNLNDNKLYVFNLTPVTDGTSKVKYKVTKRRDAIVLTDINKDNVEIYPIESFKVFADLTVNLLQDTIFNLKYKLHDGTIKTNIVTLSREAVIYAYENVDPNVQMLTAVLQKQNLLGWCPAYFGVNMYSLKKETLSTFGIAIDSFEGLASYDKENMKNLEISALKRTPDNFKDVVAARMVFLTRTMRATKAMLDLFNTKVPEITQVQRVVDKRAVLLRWATELDDELFYDTLNDSVFVAYIGSTLKDACIKRRKHMPVYLKKYTNLQNITYDTCTKAMSEGVLHIIYTTSKGSLQDLKLTTNTAILQRTYGADYVTVWETPVVKIKYILHDYKQILADAGKVNTPTLLALVNKYDLYNVLYPDNDVNVSMTTDFETVCQMALQRLSERRRSTPQDAGGKPIVITGKLADGIGFDTTQKTLSFYRTVYLNRIIYAEYSNVTTKD